MDKKGTSAGEGDDEGEAEPESGPLTAAAPAAEHMYLSPTAAKSDKTVDCCSSSSSFPELLSPESGEPPEPVEPVDDALYRHKYDDKNESSC